MIKVLVVDGHDVVRSGLTALLSAEIGIDVTVDTRLVRRAACGVRRGWRLSSKLTPPTT
ncbi:hypothetical protein ACFVAM_23995 [Streptomyces californicus]|uniref:hypothetical protein n=1 Tax=Streptomyces californicus TaxID=67351 RepID=UPI0036CE56AB